MPKRKKNAFNPVFKACKICLSLLLLFRFFHCIKVCLLYIGLCKFHTVRCVIFTLKCTKMCLASSGSGRVGRFLPDGRKKRFYP